MNGPSSRRVPADRGMELVVALLLAAAALFALAFAVVELAAPDTQLLGLLLGVAVAALGAALGLAGKRVVVQETVAEPRPVADDADGEAAQVFAEGGAGITRRGLLLATGGMAGASLVAAAAAPVGTLGPTDSGIGDSPWRAGTRLVGSDKEPIFLSQIAVGSFVTAFPEGADPRELGSPVMLVRLAPGEVQERLDWSPQGLVAFSKICTHAGCAVAMLRYGAGNPAAPGPALVCPCHYSTFDPAAAGAVLFGPAGRALPQLPLRLGAGEQVEAAGPLSGPVGPAWWSVRRS